MTIEVSRTALAVVLGVSVRTLSSLEAAGTVVPARRGRGGRASIYDLAVVIPRFIASLLSAQPATESLTEARLRVARARASLLELQHARERGLFLLEADVVRAAFTDARTIRTQLENIPPRCSAELAACGDAELVFRTLDDAIRDALSASADALAASVSSKETA